MAITKKPRPNPPVDVEALIRKGGSAAGAATEAARPAAVVLRVPAGLLARIEQSLAARPVKTPRHTWLLEAVVEKLERELAQAKEQVLS